MPNRPTGAIVSLVQYVEDHSPGVAVAEARSYGIDDSELSARLAHLSSDSAVGAPVAQHSDGPLNSFNYWKAPPSSLERLPRKVSQQVSLQSVMSWLSSPTNSPFSVLFLVCHAQQMALLK
jgi:hypothetical protein